MNRSYIEVLNLLGITDMDNHSMLEYIKKFNNYKDKQFSKSKEEDKQLPIVIQSLFFSRKLMKWRKLQYWLCDWTFKLSTSSVSPLLEIDEFIIKKMLWRHKKILNKSKTSRKRLGRQKLLKDHHIEHIKDFVHKNTWEYFTIDSI